MPLDGVVMIASGALPLADSTGMTMGAKGRRLAELAAAGLPVPAGFVLPSGARSAVAQASSTGAFRAMVSAPMDRLEEASGLRFGDQRRPLLVSVRSGAAVSMPGMLDTVLNIGLTRATIPGVIALTGNPRLAWDCYLRLIESVAATVKRAPRAPFEEATARVLAASQAAARRELDTLALRDLAMQYLEVFEAATGAEFPDDPWQQLAEAVNAVFASWDSPRARRYREIHSLSDVTGTAVTVQQMVFGNSGPRSGAGVGFTRDPITGEKHLYVDFAFDAQGEDVVSGRQPLEPTARLRDTAPAVADALAHTATRLEQLYRDAQEFEFTVEEGRLFLLQTRTAQCSPWARLRIAVDLTHEGLIEPSTALARLADLDLATVGRRRIVGAMSEPLARGIGASLGVACGRIAFSAEAARAAAARGRAVILVRDDIDTADVDGIAAADGVLTAHGAATSHAAVVARELGKVAVVGCDTLSIVADGRGCDIGGRHFGAGSVITLDGATGNVYAGAAEVVVERPDTELAEITRWRDERQ